jgi:3-methyladenine DNA glycosylase AlkD
MTDNLQKLQAKLHASINKEPERLKIFFKTGVGEYGEGDEFLGINVPTLRLVAKEFKNLSIPEIQALFKSKFNEERLLALLILTYQYQKADLAQKEKIYTFYLNNLQYINNWNLVDASAHLIVGAHLLDQDKDILFKLAKSSILWERRISIVSTWYFIRKNHYETTIQISEILLQDNHDLIHKAVGWMLREMGKKDVNILVKFLDQNAAIMPRTMLRYSIEKFPEERRKIYMTMRKKQF